MQTNGYEITPEANLTDANLTDADLRGANLRGANLVRANLTRANLRYANLTDANLTGANLTDANLRYANLRHADLRGANLHGANLHGADLYRANLQDANRLPPTTPPSSGRFTAWKKLSTGDVVELMIPSDAERISKYGDRKCRASHVVVVSDVDVLHQHSHDYLTTRYKTGPLQANSFDNDPRLDCAPGIHFFLTRQEAEEW